MKDRKKYHKDLRDEILNDPSGQGYAKILESNPQNPRDKFTKLAQKINLNRAIELGFPIVRTNIVELVMRED